jgi:hypothetical protein
MVSAALVKGSTLKVYPGFSNGMCTVARVIKTAVPLGSSRDPEQ